MHVVTTHDRSNVALSGWFSIPALIALAAAAVSWGVTGVTIVAALTLGASAAVVDARSGRIPDQLVFAAAVPVLALATAATISGSGSGPLVSVALGGLACAGPIFGVHLVSPGATGFGDVKLAAALGAALGLIDPRLGMVALCVAAGVTAAVALAWRRSSLPFGPGLVLGAAVALLIAGQLGSEASPWR